MPNGAFHYAHAGKCPSMVSAGVLVKCIDAGCFKCIPADLERAGSVFCVISVIRNILLVCVGARIHAFARVR